MIDSIYWVITHNCNDQCAHCYNDSRPGGVSLTLEDALRVVAHLPTEAPGRVILSGGEPLTTRELLFAILDALHGRYGDRTQYMLQTNGDLLTPERLDEVLYHHVTRIDIASIDRYHRRKGERRSELEAMFRSRGMSGEDTGALVDPENLIKPRPSYGFWGANEDFWIGGNWPRGRAVENRIWLRDPSHNFCAIVSGAIGFLGGKEGVPQEISIQLAELYPCCPSTVVPLADLREESVESALDRARALPVWRALNDGDPWGMGEAQGISRETADERIRTLGSVCLWCDEFFQKHYHGPRPPRQSTFVSLDPEGVSRAEVALPPPVQSKSKPSSV